jgi:hypothetical protein
MTREIVLIDAAVEDRGLLLAGLVAGAEPVLLDLRQQFQPENYPPPPQRFRSEWRLLPRRRRLPP